jgi:phosphoribosylamine--glycine ligase
MTKILLVDRSGRGHAYAELFSRTNHDVQVYYAPGCGAITTERVTCLPHLSLSDPGPLIEFATQQRIDMAFIANVMALSAGFVDEFRNAGIPVVGPDQQASRLESSKIYTKEFCARNGLPVADFVHFDNPESAIRYVKESPCQVVVKADGLCGGNGSFVCDTPEDAVRAVETLMIERKFEDAGDRVVIEKRLFGRELSFFAVLDGNSYQLLPMALDYKKSDDGNLGITCGGMGAVSPHPMESAELYGKVKEQMLTPLLKAMKKEGIDYRGVIYLGCMLVGEKIYLLEINVRMGEPEAEVVLSRIETNFFELCTAIMKQRVESCELKLNDLYFCDVVGAQGKTRQIVKGKNKGWYPGWPYGRYGKYYPIHGVEDADPDRCKVFLGEAFQHPEKGLVTDGARVLHVVGFGKSHDEAVANAYANIDHITFNGMRYRSDIGKIFPWQVLGCEGPSEAKVPQEEFLVDTNAFSVAGLPVIAG